LDVSAISFQRCRFFFGAAAVVGAGSGYLPVVGPVPLRFRPIPTVSTNTLAVPPVADPVSFIELPPEQPFPSNAPDPAPPAPVVVPAVAEPYTAEAQSPSPQAAAPVEPVVSPEMLVKYFMQPGGTNAAAAGPGQQVGFTPPLPSGKAPSQATP
jgi:hypothetical protein